MSETLTSGSLARSPSDSEQNVSTVTETSSPAAASLVGGSSEPENVPQTSGEIHNKRNCSCDDEPLDLTCKKPKKE